MRVKNNSLAWKKDNRLFQDRTVPPSLLVYTGNFHRGARSSEATLIRDNMVDSVCKRHASVLHARRKRNWQLLDATTTGDVHDHDSSTHGICMPPSKRKEEKWKGR